MISYFKNRCLKVILNYCIIFSVFTNISCKKDTPTTPPVLPIAEFGFSGSNNTFAPAKIVFTNNADNADEWLWDFGDGETSTEKTPTHIFQTAGSFEVSLRAKNKASGGTDSKIKVVITKALPKILNLVTISLSDPPYTDNQGVYFDSPTDAPDFYPIVSFGSGTFYLPSPTNFIQNPLPGVEYFWDVRKDFASPNLEHGISVRDRDPSTNNDALISFYKFNPLDSLKGKIDNGKYTMKFKERTLNINLNLVW
jgi:PKD repeat protein